jgi:predicted RNase H-like nuclease (RuvC/YqgF family)
MGNVISVLAAVVAVLLAIAGSIGGVAVFRSTRNTAIVTNYKQAADSYRERAEALEVETRDLHATNQQQAQQIAALQAQVQTLGDIVSGRSAIEELHRHMSESLGAITRQIDAAQGAVVTEIRTSREIFLHGKGETA